MEFPITNSSISYLSERSWNAHRPRVLVVACSDGRLQQNVDDFLRNALNIADYDRLYMPGGPGALAQSGFEFLRADQWRRESDFLIKAHELEEVILIFHAAAPEGPIEANCADYSRKLPTMNAHACRDQQDEDATDVLLRVFSAHSHLKMRAFRAEVRRDGKVQFIDLLSGSNHAPSVAQVEPAQVEPVEPTARADLKALPPVLAPITFTYRVTGSVRGITGTYTAENGNEVAIPNGATLPWTKTVTIPGHLIHQHLKVALSAQDAARSGTPLLLEMFADGKLVNSIKSAASRIFVHKD